VEKIRTGFGGLEAIFAEKPDVGFHAMMLVVGVSDDRNANDLLKWHDGQLGLEQSLEDRKVVNGC